MTFIVQPYSPSFQERYDAFLEFMESQKIKPWHYYLDRDQIEIRKQEMKQELADANDRLDDELGKNRIF